MKFNELAKCLAHTAAGIAVLRSTPLPFLIHDSAIIKLIAFAPVAELPAVYTDTDHDSPQSSEGDLEQ